MRAIKNLGAAAFWLAVWAAASALIGQELFLPSPVSVLVSLASLIVTGDFWLTVLHTLVSVVAGFAAGAAAGIILAVASSVSQAANAVISPAVRTLRAVPVVSFITLALLWVGKLAVPPLISALMVTPIVWQAVTSAVKGVDPLLLEMADAYSFGAAKKLRLIYAPSVFPALRSTCLTSMGLAWKSGVAAEVLCQMRSTVGAELHYSRVYLETPSLFAWTAVVAALSLLLERLVKLAARRSETKR